MAGISVQLYSVREQMAADTLGTLKTIADIGYSGVEPAGFGSLDVADFKKAVDDLGMTVSSSHGPDVMSDFDGAVETAKTLGVNWVSHMGFGGGTSLDELTAAGEQINIVCDKLDELGMSMFMHNHNGEFEAKFGPRTLFGVLFEMCPKLLTETDIYWVQVGGVDPAAIVREYAKRAPLLHVKDGPIEPASPMLAVGQGAVDVPACINAADPDVFKWGVVELDEFDGDMFEALADSYSYLVGEGLLTGNK